MAEFYTATPKSSGVTYRRNIDREVTTGLAVSRIIMGIKKRLEVTPCKCQL
jgi:hypothetical protein